MESIESYADVTEDPSASPFPVRYVDPETGDVLAVAKTDADPPLVTEAGARYLIRASRRDPDADPRLREAVDRGTS